MKKILVPLDSTPIASYVLAAAVAEARRRDAELILVRALGIPTELPLDAYVLAPDQVANLLEKSAQSELAKVRATVPADVTCRVRVEFGAAWRVVCDVAKSEDVALIVLGAHAHRTLDGVLGTTASRVIHHTDRNVLVVRANIAG